MDIIMQARGAMPEEKQRGLEAARAVLYRAGITAEEAAEGAFALEGWDDMGFLEDQEPSEAEYAAADVWYQANNAALQACCKSWPDEKRVHAIGLQLLTNPEEQLADRDTALAKLRAIIQAEDGRNEYNDERVFLLALAATAEMLNGTLAQDLVTAITVAYTPLSYAGFTPDEPIEPKRQAVFDAIDALGAATEKPTSH
ncbi:MULTISPECIES: hypothetical protein [unclassified Mesorhizobium]|uniref:hypothetical protein n=1 Tax=unclassified Mesorhizobium TaxID=325217 RepID=UPI000FCC1134|nr:MULTISPECIES: hypothetical protein [unclassified Mesorhizobium]RUX96598.1 hypothetical protein EN993_07055 [Mesorhizobium sp. M7D.F.Ca.US.004.01.2.1]RVA30022.1 hypothetical protein EN935_15830 [Mesorhizobium sp. M7D.F.Ca.US.004.03.1.1]